VFVGGKIQLIACDTDAHVVNSWSAEQQSLLAVSKPLNCLTVVLN